MEQLISDLFHQSIEAKIEHAESLVEPLQNAASVITNCLLQEGKLLICAEGISESLATTLAHCMLNGQQLERPGLPTVVLSRTLHDQDSHNDPFSAQIRTLSSQEDVLMVISSGSMRPSLLAAVVSAQQNNLGVIALTTPGCEQIRGQLRSSDVELFANNVNQYRIQEIQLLILFCLCQLIENNLFGEVS
ncbi:MAG: SIS domain-containing protein [Porticoccaceae bacterium]|nr:SIS domain-containing protein [Porticoccaceae bacterium]